MVITSTGLPWMSMERPGVVMLEVGLSARLATIGWPEEMPPRMPPALLLRKPSGVSSSRCWVPRWETLSKELTAARERVKARKKSVRAEFDKWVVDAKPDEVEDLVPTNKQFLHIPLDDGQGNTVKYSEFCKEREAVIPGGFTWAKGRGESKAFSLNPDTAKPGEALTVADAHRLGRPAGDRQVAVRIDVLGFDHGAQAIVAADVVAAQEGAVGRGADRPADAPFRRQLQRAAGVEIAAEIPFRSRRGGGRGIAGGDAAAIGRIAGDLVGAPVP